MHTYIKQLARYAIVRTADNDGTEAILTGELGVSISSSFSTPTHLSDAHNKYTTDASDVFDTP